MSQEFFENNLNYSYANEDSSVEAKILAKVRAEVILSVCGSGSRTAAITQPCVREIDLVDLSETQLSWSKLFLGTYKDLTYDEYCEFWGYKSIAPSDRKKKYYSFIEKYDTRLLNLFDENTWQEPLYFGKWEKTYQKLSKIVQIVVGKKLIKKLEMTDSISEQWNVVNKFSFKIRWHAVLFIVGNRALFNSLLYKGHFVEKNISQSYVDFYVKAFERLFHLSHIKQSFFLQFSFLGKLKYQDGAVFAASKNIFETVKKHHTKVKYEYINADIMNYLANANKKYQMMILSDVPSYFSDELGESFLQRLQRNLDIGGLVIVRYYLRVYVPDLSGFEDITDEFSDIISDERVQMYQIKVYKRVT